jgi:hypothetical protein
VRWHDHFVVRAARPDHGAFAAHAACKETPATPLGNWRTPANSEGGYHHTTTTTTTTVIRMGRERTKDHQQHDRNYESGAPVLNVPASLPMADRTLSRSSRGRCAGNVTPVSCWRILGGLVRLWIHASPSAVAPRQGAATTLADLPTLPPPVLPPAHGRT